MPALVLAAPSSGRLLAIDTRKLLFSFSSFVAAAATLLIAFTASLPRPWWALLTVYVTAQPMAGAFRPKVLYRLGGILIGAVASIILVPALQNSPPLLVLCLAAWTGFCIYLAVLDRTPRAFLFQMAAFSSAVISFPYVDDPANIFTSTISRVEEMMVGIVCVTAAHALIQPWSATPLIRAKAEAFLADAGRWTAQALGARHTALEYERRRILAADVTELGMLAIHLPFDQGGAATTRDVVLELQKTLASILSIASAAANRLDLLRALGPLDTELKALVQDAVRWLASPLEPADHQLVARCSRLASRFETQPDWRGLLSVSVCSRMAEFVDLHQQARALTLRIGTSAAERGGSTPERAAAFPLARDHGVAALAGFATATAVILYCAVWVLMAWPNGSATAAFAALITCSFAMQDDPAPGILSYLGATLLTFPLAALYLFVILPRVDGCAMLVLVLAPALLGLGYLQADPRRSARALPMFSCFIVAMGFLDRFEADFATFLNTGLAQVGGIVATLIVTKMFRSADVTWTAGRIIRSNWRDLESLADIRRRFEPASWTAQATDRLGQIAARMAMASSADALHAADGLADLRIGRNLISIRRALAATPHDTRSALGRVLSGVSPLFRTRRLRGAPIPPPESLLATIDAAIGAMLASRVEVRHDALLALVGIRCNLFPAARPYQSELPA